MSEQKGIFVDRSGQTEPPPELWEPAIIKRADFESEIKRLSEIPMPNNGRRQSWIIHPDAHKLGVGLGFAPGIRPIIEVLNPGGVAVLWEAVWPENRPSLSRAMEGVFDLLASPGTTTRTLTDYRRMLQQMGYDRVQAVECLNGQTSFVVAHKPH